MRRARCGAEADLGRQRTPGAAELTEDGGCGCSTEPAQSSPEGVGGVQLPPENLRKVKIRSWVLHLDCEDWRHRVLGSEEVTWPPGPKEGMDWRQFPPLSPRVSGGSYNGKGLLSWVPA